MNLPLCPDCGNISHAESSTRWHCPVCGNVFSDREIVKGEQTPLPWRVCGPFGKELEMPWFDIEGCGYSIAHVCIEQRPSKHTLEDVRCDANFIVLAVNNHQKLVEALEKLSMGVEFALAESEPTERLRKLEMMFLGHTPELALAKEALTEAKKGVV